MSNLILRIQSQLPYSVIRFLDSHSPTKFSAAWKSIKIFILKYLKLKNNSQIEAKNISIKTIDFWKAQYISCEKKIINSYIGNFRAKQKFLLKYMTDDKFSSVLLNIKSAFSYES